MSKLPSISSKFSRYTWITGLIACLLVLFVTVDSEVGLLKRQTAIEIARIYDAAKMEVEKFFFNDQALISYLKERALEQHPTNYIKWFGDNLRHGDGIQNFIILDENNKIAYISDPKNTQYIGLNFSNLEYIKAGRRVSGVHQSFFTSRPVITICYPLQKGTLLIEKDLGRLNERLKDIPRPSIDESLIFILNKDGTAVYHPDKTLVKTRENLRSKIDYWSSADDYGFSIMVYDNARYWCMKKGFNRPQSWYFYAVIPENKIIPYLWHHMWPIVITIFAIFGAIVFFVDLIISYGISEPLKSLSQWLLKQDPMNADINPNISPTKTSYRELHDIVESVKKMLETIKTKNSEILKRDELFRTVIEYAADWAYWLDESGSFKYNSIKCQEITGYSPDEFQKDPMLLTKIIHKDDKAIFDQHLDSMVTNKPHKNIEFRIITKDGHIRWISHNCNKIYDSSGNFLGVRGSNLDITEQKLASEELSKIDKLESLGLVAGGIAHDFNNLLTAILGNISLAKMEADPSSNIYKRLDASEKASLRAQNLTQQLLTFAKGGSPVKKPSSLKRIILETAEFALKGSNVACKFDFDQDLWIVEVDTGQISQVLHNLILNADQAMPDGGVIKIKARNIKVQPEEHTIVPPGDYVVITVQDQGKGIPPELLSKIFDPYFTTKENGSGLGLAVCFSIVRKHGGFITVDSAPGQGASFNVYLPALREQNISQDEEQNAPKDQTHGKNILIMDDDPSVLQLLTESLKYLGHNIDTAMDGSEALAKYQEAMQQGKTYDAVIMDLTIPGGMGGKEALVKLLQIDPKAKVIVSSGYSKDDTITNYKRYGFCASLPKPYKLEVLNSILLNVFSE